MAKKAGSITTTDGDPTSGTSAKHAPNRTKAGAKKKKTSTKKEKKAKRTPMKKEEAVAVIAEFHERNAQLTTLIAEFFAHLRKDKIALPGKSRKALAATARDLRKAARSVKRLADHKGK